MVEPVAEIPVPGGRIELHPHGVVRHQKALGAQGRRYLPLGSITHVDSGTQRNPWLLIAGLVLLLGAALVTAITFGVHDGPDAPPTPPLAIAGLLALTGIACLVAYLLYKTHAITIQTPTAHITYPGGSGDAQACANAIEELLTAQPTPRARRRPAPAPTAPR